MTIWTEAQIDLLKSGVARGLTFSTIARELGVTRNAVIGKAHRLGLSAQTLNRGGAGTGTHKLKRKGKRGTQAMRTQVTITEPAPAPPADGVTLLELRSHHCRWPLGPERATADCFCGAVVEPGYPYCRAHGCRAYLGPRWARVAAELAARAA